MAARTGPEEELSPRGSAAVVLAGVLPVEEGARLIARRAALMQALPAGGGMAALLGPRAAAEALLRRHPALEPAALNAPTAMTVAGPLAALARLEADPAVTSGEIAAHPLPVSHAFHSRLLEPMLDELAAAAAGLAHAPPRVPVVGNLTGQVQPAWDGAYWRAHARAPVRFADGLASLAGLGCELLVELGPQPVLAGFARSVLPDLPVLPTLARGREPWGVLLNTLAELHRHGADPDWTTLDQPLNTTTTSAPNYPFQRQRFWLDDPTLSSTSAPPPRTPDDVGDERIWGFYDQLAEIARGYQERPGEPIDGHLTFGLLDAPEPGFSWLRTLFDGPAAGAEHVLLTRSQRAIKELAFAPVDLSALRRVMDFGCGHGADLITLAEKAPHLELHGFTISARQVAVGRERAAARGLRERVHIHHGDSAKDAFPGSFDLIFGFEVAGLIEDKAALFANIGAHLAPGGVVVMADFVATGDRIAALDTASFTPTATDWAELLAGRRLRITSCVDTSVEVANFLDDPGFAGEVDRLMRAYNFGEAGRQIQDFLWSEFADWYVEIAKVQLEGDAQRQQLTREVLYTALEGTLRLLHPFMPFVTEEAWQYLTSSQFSVLSSELDRTNQATQYSKLNTQHSIMVAPYPTADAGATSDRPAPTCAVRFDTDPSLRVRTSEHRRLRIEQELREARIRMRRMVTDGDGGVKFLDTGKAPRLTASQALKHSFVRTAGGARIGRDRQRRRRVRRARLRLGL